MATIVLADDHCIVRQGVRNLLEAEPDFRLVGEAADGLEACRLVRELRPDILILDMIMDGLDGIEAARYVSKHSPKTGVVILTMCDSLCYMLEALRAGAKAYVLKECTSDDLVIAIREVLRGKRYLSRPIPESAIASYASCAEATDRIVTPLAELTARERDVFHLASQGFTNAEIADQLFISRRTAECHRSRMMHKLGLRRQVDLVLYALKQGVSIPSTPVFKRMESSFEVN